LVGCAGLWWVHFDRSADEAARVIAASAQPGRRGRSAYHFVHPIMVAGIIVAAGATLVVLTVAATDRRHRTQSASLPPVSPSGQLNSD
jgi:low temperature requirement protein LtrA